MKKLFFLRKEEKNTKKKVLKKGRKSGKIEKDHRKEKRSRKK